MNQTDEIQANCLSPAVCQQVDNWLGGSYGGYINGHSVSEIESQLAGALESEGVTSEIAREVIYKHGMDGFDQAVAYKLAADAIRIARERG